ncbi:MAG: elongation factor Ts [Chloroflexota bacterium]|nr:MAG: elongation factor Ts [Chloroflexota bacterium]
MASTTEQIKKLREETGAGILDAKKTLEQVGGDYDKALSILKAKGIAKAEQKAAERTAKDGAIETYVHNGKVGVMVELNCETDFVARTPQFKEAAHAVALQIAAMDPKYVSVEAIPAEELEAQKKTFTEATLAEGKPENMIEKIVAGKLDKYFAEVVLLRQPYIKDDKQTIEDVVTTASAQTGEKIVVRRFTRYALGE